MKHIQTTLLLSLFGFLTFFAKVGGILPACEAYGYQPNVPKSLLK